VPTVTATAMPQRSRLKFGAIGGFATNSYRGGREGKGVARGGEASSYHATGRLARQS
jgi:hypothetical protein